MAAPAITLNPGAVPYTITPLDKDGWRMNMSVSQLSLGADYSVSVSIQKVDVSLIDDPDETATFNATTKIPFGEAPDLPSLTAKIQALADTCWDNFIPQPGN